MSVLSSDLFTPAPVPAGGLAPLAAQWAAIHEAAALVAALAGQAGDQSDAAVGSYPAAIHRAGGRRLALALGGLADLSVILQAGLRGLLCVQASGANAAPAAQALHAEFRASRDALLKLAPPEKRPLS